MAKIRGIKPETWTDEDLVSVSAYARLLFIGLWNFACDNGHLDDKPRQIKMRILPADPCDVDELLGELTDLGLVERRDGARDVTDDVTPDAGEDADDTDVEEDTTPDAGEDVGDTDDDADVEEDTTTPIDDTGDTDDASDAGTDTGDDALC